MSAPFSHLASIDYPILDADAHVNEPPNLWQVFHRNFYSTFMVDRSGLELRHRLNVDHLMWSTDYPHSGTDWPNSGVSIENLFRGVPQDEVKKMLRDNCKTLYRLDVPDRLM